MIPLERIKLNGKVDMWDLGPQVAPKPPAAPEAPDKAKFKNAMEFAAAELEYEDAIETYKDQLRAYSAAKKAHHEWIAQKGGPIKVEFWGIDATEAMQIEPDRFKLDLPKGMKPGKAQLEADEMAKETAEEIRQARKKDPLHAGAAA